jgi:hypothetical protein
VPADSRVVSSLPTWAAWSIFAAAVLSPVLAFVMAMAVEIVIGALVSAGALPAFALVTAGVVGGLLLRKQWGWRRGRALVQM